jgi:PKD repeat protein
MTPEWWKTMPGSRWKGTRFRAGVVTKLLLAFILLLALVAVPASAWLAGYQNGTQFTLNTGTTLTDYQIGLRLSNLTGVSFATTFGGSNGGIAVLYTNGTTKADWSDIRFTDGSDTSLAYWIETGTQNATSAFVWVRVPSISSAGTTKIRFYYGNSGASSNSNGLSTFNNYFSDFDSLNNWTIKGTGTWSTSNSILTIPGTRWQSYLQFNTPAPTYSYNGEFKYEYTNAGSQPIIEFEANDGMVWSSANQYNDYYSHNGYIYVFQNWMGSYQYAQYSPWAMSTWYIGRFIRVSGSNQGQVYNTGRTSLGGPTAGVVNGGGTGHYYGFADSGAYGTWLCDWFYLRNYSSSEPTTSTFLPVGAPTASFTMNPVIGDVPLTVQFTDTSVDNPTTWVWNFGDGTPTSPDQNPAHTYTSAGVYQVTLTASNSYGGSIFTNSSYIYVNNPDSAPGPMAYAECEAEQSKKSTSWSDACTLTLNAVAGDYVIAASFEVGNDLTYNYPTLAKLTINGADKNVVRFPPQVSTDRKNEGWVRCETFSAGSQTITVQYAGSYGSPYYTYIRNIHIMAWKAPTPKYTYTKAEVSYTSSETTIQTLSFAPSVQKDYLILASAETRVSDTYYYGSNLTLKVDGVQVNRIYFNSESASYTTTGIVLGYVPTLTAASHTITLTGINPTGGTGYAGNSTIIAIPLSGIVTYKSSDETRTSTTSTSYVNKLSYSPSLGNSTNYLVFGSSLSDMGVWPYTNLQMGNNLAIEGTQYQEQWEQTWTGNGYPTQIYPFFAIKRLSLTSGSRTFAIKHKTTNSVYPIYTNNSRILVIEYPKPTVMWNATPRFANITTPIVFVDNSTGWNITAGGTLNFNWSFNQSRIDQNVSTLRNWTHTFPCTALPTVDYCSYSVNHSVTDSPGTTWALTSWLNQSNYLRIFQNESPTVTFTGTPLSGLAPLSVAFTGAPVGTIGVDNWSWNFGDGHTSYDQNPTNIYSSAGTYTVSLTAVNYTLGITTVTQTNYITVSNPKPTVVWNATPLIANLTTALVFVDSSTGTNITAGGTFNWSFNSNAMDTNVSSLRNWTHTFPCTALPTADSCYYSVNHSVTDSPGTLWANTSWLNQSNYIRVFQNESPTVTFTGTPLSGSSPLSVAFTGTPVGAIRVDYWSWDFGDGHTSNNQNPTNIYTGAGVYTVSLTAVNYTLGTTTVTKVNYITVSNPKPTVVWNATPLFANTTTPIVFVDSSTGTNITQGGNFNWSFNNDATDQNVSSARNWSHTFPCTALPTVDSCYYSVNHSVTDSPSTLWANTSWLNQSNYLRIFQNESPTVTFTGDPPSGGWPFEVTFTATPAGDIRVDSWSWDFGDGQTSTEQNPKNTFYGAGDYTVSLTAVNYTLGTTTVTKVNWVRCM